VKRENIGVLATLVLFYYLLAYKRKVKNENKFNPLYNPRRVKSF